MIRTLAMVVLLGALISFAAYSEIRERNKAIIASQIKQEKADKEAVLQSEHTNQESVLRTIDMNLLTEAGWGHTDKVRLLLESGADVNARDTNGDTPLIAAAFMGFNETVRLLLDKGADVNAQNNLGSTALMEAATMNKPEAVELLLSSGAETTAKNMAGLSALDLALKEKHLEMGNLLKFGAITKSARRFSSTALDAGLLQASAEGDVSKTRELLTNGANVNATNKFGWTALMHAAFRGDNAVLALLLANRADLNRADSQYGRTALILATMEGHADIVEALLKGGANPNAEDKTGSTAMSVVQQLGNSQIGRLLKQAGAKTPLHTQIVSQP